MNDSEEFEFESDEELHARELQEILNHMYLWCETHNHKVESDEDIALRETDKLISRLMLPKK